MNNERYTEVIENLLILLAGAYQQTHDMLLLKTKEGNKAFFEMQTVQGSAMVFCIDAISKLNTKGVVSSEELDWIKGHLRELYGAKPEEEQG